MGITSTLEQILEPREIRIGEQPDTVCKPCVEFKVDKDIVFRLGVKDVLRLSDNGNIYVKEKLIQNDIEVVDALREWLASVTNGAIGG